MHSKWARSISSAPQSEKIQNLSRFSSQDWVYLLCYSLWLNEGWKADTVAQPSAEGSVSIVTCSGQCDSANTEGGDDRSYSSRDRERTLLKVIHNYTHWIWSLNLHFKWTDYRGGEWLLGIQSVRFMTNSIFTCFISAAVKYTKTLWNQVEKCQKNVICPTVSGVFSWLKDRARTKKLK